MSTLQEFESKERQLCSQLFNRINTIKEYKFTTGRICYDFCVTTTQNKHLIGDVKCRRFKRDKYNTYILEVTKLQGLIKKAEKLKQDSILYVNFFECDETNKVEFIIFNLTERIKIWKKKPPKIDKMKMNIETWKSEDVKAYKEIILLEFDEKIDSKGEFYLN